MDTQQVALPQQPEKVTLISINKFIFLNIITFNLYAVWWVYKTWRFFKYHDRSEILPAVRSIFYLFTLSALFYKIKAFAISYGSREKYSSGFLHLSVVICYLFYFCPGYLVLVAQIMFYFYLRPLAAFNFAVKKDDRYDGVIESKLNAFQIALVICGSLLWICVIITMLNGDFNKR